MTHDDLVDIAIRSDIVADIISLDLCDVECDVIHYLEKTGRA